MSRLLSSSAFWISIRIMDNLSAISLHTPRLSAAIRFSIKTHEVYQKQKRKGKDIPYITHPLIVGLILARAGSDEDVVIAGILHDTIEDSPSEKKVTKAMIAERFGDRVADLVDAVTEQDKSLTWEERKQVALQHIAQFSHDELLVKSADIISNTTELIDDFRKHGEETFARFNAPKEKALGHAIDAIDAVLESWPESPLARDLSDRATSLRRMLEPTTSSV
jgi:(p)ppGpp synthase/HD superfamily hydrolase